MNPESALLETVIIVFGAVVAAVGAVLMLRATSRIRSGLAQRHVALARATEETRREAAAIRTAAEHSIAMVEGMRVEGASRERDIVRLTDALREQREGIERVTHGRLATVIRVASVMSKAARFALLWR